MLKRPSVSSLVKSQIPEHIRNDNGGFVTFLEAYYKYLDENEVDFVSTRDLDTTLDSFLSQFRKELAINLPVGIEVDERFLLRHIKEHYLAKGSEQSYKFLFKILFNKDIELAYPSTQMLRASAGNWSQDISIFAKIETGDPDDIIGRLVDVITPSKIVRVLIDRRQYVEVEVERAIKVSDDVYEFIIDRRYFGDITVGDRLRYRDDSKGIFFTADILATTSGLEIKQAGTGFKVGQLYEIRNFDGYGSIMKVTSLTPEGGIKSAEYIKYGIGYSTDFLTTIVPESGQEDATIAGTTVIRAANALSISERMDGFSEVGTVNYYDYASTDYMDGTYCGFTSREFGISTKDAQVSDETPAIIDVKLGALAAYPGYFVNNDGFLSDAIFIQDSRYYQAYSYVIKIDETLASYKTAVKSLIHPAGTALFGEYDIRNEFDLSLELESLIKILSITEQDEVFAESSDLGVDGNLFDLVDVTKDVSKYVAEHVLLNGTVDDNTVTMIDTSGTLTTRTVPYLEFDKLFNGTELDYDLNTANHEVTLTENLYKRDVGKIIDATSTDLDGNLDDETVTIVSRDLGVSGSLTGTTDVTLDTSLLVNAVSRNYDGNTDSESVTIVEPPISMGYTTSESVTTRFGLSVIDSDKALATTQNISDTDASSPTDLNRTTPAFSVTFTIGDRDDYDGNPIDDSVSFSESGFVDKNPYTNAGYFLNDGGIYVSDGYATI